MLVDAHTRRALRLADVLRSQGWELDFAANSRTAQSILAQQSVDAVVTADRLPDGSGLDLCAKLRERGAVYPIVVLSEEDSTESVLRGFNAGADDVFRHPLNEVELQAKLRAMCKRTQRITNCEMNIGDLHFDPIKRVVQTSVGPMRLGKYSYHLLCLLMEEAPAVVSFQAIDRRLWPNGLEREAARRAHVYNLRKALREHVARVTIRTHHTYGYSLRASVGHC